MHHDRVFWSYVESYLPDRKVREGWLKQNQGLWKSYEYQQTDSFVCLLLLLLVGGVSFHLIHQSPKYIAQKKEIEKQESQLVHDKDTKLPYTFLNNVIAQSGATSSVYYKSPRYGRGLL